MHEELKPCPFCGGDAELDSRRSYRSLAGHFGTSTAIYCLACSADMSICREDVPDLTAEDRIGIVTEAWNLREAATALEQQPTTVPSARIKALEEAVDDEGVLAEACERAVRDCHPELARKIHVGLFNMIGRHMAHHLKDVRKEFAERAALTQQSEGGAS